MIVNQWKRDRSWFVPTNISTCSKEKAKSNLKNPINVSEKAGPEKSTSSHQMPLDCTIQSILNNTFDVAQIKTKRSIHFIQLVKLEMIAFYIFCIALEQTSIYVQEMG